MSKLKIAIIGVGNIAQSHIHGYTLNPDVELYAFCDINAERLQYMGKKYGVERLYTDEETMLKELPEINAVSVCTWNSQHAPCTIMALNAGKNVLCEKPMALNAEQAEAMKEAAEKNGKLLMIGFVRRYGNDAKILKDYIDNGYFGEIYYGKATYLRRNGSPGSWFGEKARSGGGPLIDLGVHVIDLTRYLMGNPKPISVFGATFHKLANRPGIKDKVTSYQASSDHTGEIFDVEDLATAMIRYDNGAVVSIEAAFSLNIKENEGKIQLFGTKAGAKLDPSLEMYTELNGYMSNVTLDTATALDFDGLFEGEIDHYVDCLLGRTEKCISPAEDGVTLMKILDGIYRSAETGHEVLLK